MSFIDRESSKALNIPEIMEMIKPFSDLGRKLKNSAKPFSVGKEPELRLEYKKLRELTAALKSGKDFRLSLTMSLSKIDNIRHTLNRLNSAKELEIHELFEIKQFVYYYEQISRNLVKLRLDDKLIQLDSFADLFKLLDPENQISPAFSISSRYSDNLAALRSKFFELNNISKHLETNNLEHAKEELGLQSLDKQVTVSRQNKKMVTKLTDSRWFNLSSENFANITFSFRQSEDYIKLEKELNQLRKKIDEEELAIRNKLTAAVSNYEGALLKALNEIAKLDYMMAKALFGIENNCTIPAIHAHISNKDNHKEAVDFKISIAKAVNLVMKKGLVSSKLEYQPVDLNFTNRINIITGANMAGKSTILKTLGQIFYLCSNAIPLPCSKASLPLVDFIFFSSATEESHRTDLSSFTAEMVAINSAIKMSGSGLFLIDEFARGTNPKEGEAFARTIIESFLNKCGIVFSATHFNSPSEIKKAAHYRIIGLSQEDYEELKRSLAPFEQKDKDDLSKRIQELHKYMDYRLEAIESSLAPPQAALMIAEILGIEKDLIERAKSYLLEQDEKKV